MPITPTPHIWMNGEMVPWEQAQIHVLSPTRCIMELAYSKVFVPMRLLMGQPFFGSPSTLSVSSTRPESSTYRCRTRFLKSFRHAKMS